MQMNLIYKQINNLAEVKEKYAEPERPKPRKESDEFNFVFPELTSIAENSQQKLMTQIRQMTEQMEGLQAQMKQLQKDGRMTPADQQQQQQQQRSESTVPIDDPHPRPIAPDVQMANHDQWGQHSQQPLHPQQQLHRPEAIASPVLKTVGFEKSQSSQADIFRPFDAPPPNKIECGEARAFPGIPHNPQPPTQHAQPLLQQQQQQQMQQQRVIVRCPDCHLCFTDEEEYEKHATKG